MSTPISEQLTLFNLGPSIELLREEADNLMRYQQAKNTGKAYAYWWSRFADWCKEYRREARPATPETVRYFVSYCIKEGLSVPTVNLALAAVTHEHVRARLATPVDPSVRLLVRSAKKKLKRKSRAKLALTPELLQRIGKELMRQGSNRAARDHAALVLGFASSWRRSELAALQLADVTWLSNGHFELFLAKEKTDQEAKGRKIEVSPGERRETCPVRVLRAWLKIRGKEPGPLLCAISRAGDDKPRPERSVRGGAIAYMLKGALSAIGENPAAYAAHSMRSGHITIAAQNGVPIPVIQNNTGQKKIETLFRYIRPIQNSRVNAMAGVL